MLDIAEIDNIIDFEILAENQVINDNSDKSKLILNNLFIN